MHCKSPKNYLVKRDLDVFHSGNVLPLEEGKGFFNSKSKLTSENLKTLSGNWLLKKAFTLTSKPGYSNIQYPSHRNNIKFPVELVWPKLQNLKKNFQANGSSNLNLWENNFFYNFGSASFTDVIRMKCSFEKTRMIGNLQQVKQTKKKAKRKNNHYIKAEKTKVFTDEESVRKLVPKSFIITIDEKWEVDVDNLETFSDLKELRTLCQLLSKFLLKKRISISETKKLSQLESKLFLPYINKKKDRNNQVKEVSEDTLAKLNEQWIKRNSNENLRYVVTNTIKLMQKHFKETMFCKVRPFLKTEFQSLNERAQLDYCFYGYYFLDVVSYIPKPVERYFHRRSRRNPDLATNDFIPTQVSETYLNNLRTSKLFVRDFVAFLKGPLQRDTQNNVLFCVKNTCRTWEKNLKELGQEVLVDWLTKRLKSKFRLKIPWTVQEVDDGILDILGKLGKL